MAPRTSLTLPKPNRPRSTSWISRRSALTLGSALALAIRSSFCLRFSSGSEAKREDASPVGASSRSPDRAMWAMRGGISFFSSAAATGNAIPRMMRAPTYVRTSMAGLQMGRRVSLLGKCRNVNPGRMVSRAGSVSAGVQETDKSNGRVVAVEPTRKAKATTRARTEILRSSSPSLRASGPPSWSGPATRPSIVDNDLATGGGAQCPPGLHADRVAEEANAAVTQRGVHPLRVPAPSQLHARQRAGRSGRTGEIGNAVRSAAAAGHHIRGRGVVRRLVGDKPGPAAPPGEAADVVASPRTLDHLRDAQRVARPVDDLADRPGTARLTLIGVTGRIVRRRGVTARREGQRVLVPTERSAAVHNATICARCRTVGATNRRIHLIEVGVAGVKHVVVHRQRPAVPVLGQVARATKGGQPGPRDLAVHTARVTDIGSRRVPATVVQSAEIDVDLEQVVLLHVRKDCDHPRAPATSRPADAREKGAIGALVVHVGQGDLLDVVGAFHPIRGLANLLDGRQQETDQDRDDCDDD